MNIAPGITIANRFQLVSKLGEGGMGCVWLAQHLGLGIPCAVKLILPETGLTSAVRARFEREAKAVAQIQSPHVVQIFDSGVWEEMPYIAMEYLSGEDLARRLQARGTLSPTETLSIIADTARALVRAHAVGIVHRDLKPGNIFLVQTDEREIAKVLDFGIAKDLSVDAAAAQTKTGALLGTPFYMSPEQARGDKRVDHRADLWSLGVIAYQCLTGSMPFMGEALGDLFMRIIVEPLPIPSHVAPVPPGFDAWWARAVARNPDARFQSARDLVSALGTALGLSHGVLGEGFPSGIPQRISLVTMEPQAPPNLMATVATGRQATPNPTAPAAPQSHTPSVDPWHSSAIQPSHVSPQQAAPITPQAHFGETLAAPMGSTTPAATSAPPAGRSRFSWAVIAVAIPLAGLVAFAALRGKPHTATGRDAKAIASAEFLASPPASTFDSAHVAPLATPAFAPAELAPSAAASSRPMGEASAREPKVQPAAAPPSSSAPSVPSARTSPIASSKPAAVKPPPSKRYPGIL